MISLSLCEIMIEVMPRSLSWRSSPSRCAESLSLSAAVGSSRISSRTSFDSALAISTSCCLPTPSWPTGVTGFSSRPTEASSLRGLGVGQVPVDEAAAAPPLVAEEDVLGDRQVRHQRELLVDDHDPDVLAVADAAEVHRLAVVDDLAVVAAGRVDAREHLHQRGLAGAVLTADRVDLAAADVEVDVLQRLDPGEGLGDGAHLQDVLGHGSRRPRRRVRCAAQECGPCGCRRGRPSGAGQLRRGRLRRRREQRGRAGLAVVRPGPAARAPPGPAGLGR